MGTYYLQPDELLFNYCSMHQCYLYNALDPKKIQAALIDQYLPLNAIACIDPGPYTSLIPKQWTSRWVVKRLNRFSIRRINGIHSCNDTESS